MQAAVPYRWPVKALHLAFLRRLCALGLPARSELITPGNVYNRRWEEQLGADPARIRTVYNGVDPADFPALDGEPEVPTISWAGRIDPVKDLETLLRAFALVHQEMPARPAAHVRLARPGPGGLPGTLPGTGRRAGHRRAGDASRAGSRTSATPTPPARSWCSAASPKASPTP